MGPDDRRDLQQITETLKALDALKGVNLVVAPIEPTEEMCRLAALATGLDADVVRKVYQVMILSSQDIGGGPPAKPVKSSLN